MMIPDYNEVHVTAHVGLVLSADDEDSTQS
jgi:hypothetical protein